MYNAIADRELGLTTGTLTLLKQYDSEVFHRIPGDLLSRILEVTSSDPCYARGEIEPVTLN